MTTPIALSSPPSARTASQAALLLRLGLGTLFLAHGLTKLLVFTPAGTAQFFSAHGFPGWSAYPVMWLEIIGGVLLIAGLFTRAIALLLLPVLAGALLVHLPNGWAFESPGGGWEFIAILMVGLAAQVLLGDGAYALGRVLQRQGLGASPELARARS